MTTDPVPQLDEGTNALLQLARQAGDFTRADVAARTGWARSTVQARLDQLLSMRLLMEAEPRQGQRGRPATRYRFKPDRGLLLVADIGASGARIAQCDLASTVLARTEVTVNVGEGPESVLQEITRAFDTLLSPADRHQHLWGVGLSLPGPVETATGTVISPPIMRSWDGFDVPAHLRSQLGSIPVFVDNDANAMAWGERQTRYVDTDNLICIKVGTGVGAGVVANGQPLRGALGAAGDIGHTWATTGEVRDDRPLCLCGKTGCVEAYVGGWALSRDLRAEGIECTSTSDVIRLLDDGHPVAIKLIRDAGRILGASLAEAVSLFNPSVVVIGGRLSTAGEHLLSGTREHVALRSLPLATRDLIIEPTELHGDSGILGLAHLIADHVLTQPKQRLPIAI